MHVWLVSHVEMTILSFFNLFFYPSESQDFRMLLIFDIPAARWHIVLPV